MNEIKIFKNERFGEIRTAGTSEEPLFCLADVCRAIGIKDVPRCASRLEDDMRQTHPIIDSLGRTQQATFVTESGLYDVIIRSDSENAKPFRRWVCGEVLPSIRKMGNVSSTDTITELIKITEHDGKRAVSARELHKFLESKQDFSTWIKNRIEKYDLVENQDYATAPQIYGTANRGYSTRLEYALTIDAAKELSMVEGNERGKLARKYFIACEKRLKEMSMASYQIDDPIARAQRWIEEQKEKKRIEEQNKVLAVENKEQADKIAADAPKVLFANALKASDRSILVGELAKILKQNGCDTGQKRLFAWLRENGYLMKGGSERNQPTQRSMELGLFEVTKGVVTRPDDTVITTVTTKVTAKGQEYFINKFIKGKQ